jgi:hypothetical protein
VTTITTQTTLHSNIATVTHNSKHYNVKSTGRCNTPKFISSLLIELPIQSVANNTDFSSRLFMSFFNYIITQISVNTTIINTYVYSL